MVKNKLDCFGSILFKIIELGRFKINKKKSICVGMIYFNRLLILRIIEYLDNFFYIVFIIYFEDICICVIYKVVVNKNKYLIIFIFLKFKWDNCFFSIIKRGI